MALIHCDFNSEVLDLNMSMCVILPEPLRSEGGVPQPRGEYRHPTLYVLHGLSDDHTAWLRMTSIERYVAPLDLAVVMPAVHRSVYTDMAHGIQGHQYWTFISEELPALVRWFFPLADAREDNFVAGLSMGGYGAYKLALSHPSKYAAAASLSGALNVARLVEEPELFDEDTLTEFGLVFGDLDKLPGSEKDLFHLARRLGQSGAPRPRLYQWCGTEDVLHSDNVQFKELAESLALDLTYEEGPGEHEWIYWDRQIQRVLEWLPTRPVAEESLN